MSQVLVHSSRHDQKMNSLYSTRAFTYVSHQRRNSRHDQEMNTFYVTSVCTHGLHQRIGARHDGKNNSFYVYACCARAELAGTIEKTQLLYHSFVYTCIASVSSTSSKRTVQLLVLCFGVLGCMTVEIKHEQHCYINFPRSCGVGFDLRV